VLPTPVDLAVAVGKLIRKWTAVFVPCEENLVGQRKGPTVFGEPYFDEMRKSRHELLRIFGGKPRDCCGAQLCSTGYCSERRVCGLRLVL
jgi:hypothetical protein